MQSFDDFRAAARRRLPHFLFEYIDGGAGTETTMRANARDLEAIALRQRILRDVSHIDLSVDLFGQRCALPVALGPVGLSGMYARRGEVQAARAAAEIGVPFTLSTVGACSIAEVQRGSPTPFWFQLYMVRDRGFMADLIDAATEARCGALMFTVDMPVAGIRYRDGRSGLAHPLLRIWQALKRPQWSWDVGVMGRPHTLGSVAPVLGGRSGMDDFFAWINANFDPSISLKDLEWVRARWRGPLIVKGLLDAEDARGVVDAGADGIVVSNHGGRQLDGAASVARVLPSVAETVGDRCTVLADGGVRSGADVVRLLALGARAALLGRAWAFALAADGQAGVARMLETLRREIAVTMALTGATHASAVRADVLLNRQVRAPVLPPDA